MAYATWNPSDKSSAITLSNGNLTATATNTAWKSARATMGKSSGKWYFEIYINLAANTQNYIGIGTSGASVDTLIGANAYSWGYRGYSGEKFYNNILSSYGASYSTSNIIGVALDMDNGKIWFAKNGVWQASGDPAAGTNAAFSGITGTIFPMISLQQTNTQITANFGASAFTYTVPSGFYAGLADEVGTTYLEDLSLDIAAYYQHRDDLLTWLGITDGTRLEDLKTDLAAYLESTGDDLSAWLGTGYEHMNDLKSWLGLLATHYCDLKSDLSIRAQNLEDLETWIAASKTTFKDLAVWLGVTNGTILKDLAAWLGVTDGNIVKDLRVWAGVISAIPAFRSVTAHRVSSVIHEVV